MAILKRTWLRVSTTAVLALCLAASARVNGEQRTPTAEDDIKAAFLFNFTRFIDWPVPPVDAFRICTLAEPGFNAALDRTLVDETVHGLPILRFGPPTIDAARACQILFVGRLENGRAERWIAALRGTPVLIVGESRGAWSGGAHLNFIVDDNRVQFDVNVDAAKRDGLSISSKLLRVARNTTLRMP
ncbi:MAG: YfiR family protein [Vicinamibacterales bacterium]